LLGLVRFALTGSRGDLLRAFACGAAVALLGLAVPLLTVAVFDGAIPSADRSQVLLLVGAMAVQAICAGLFSVSAALALQRLSIRFAGRALTAIWNHVLALPAWAFRGRSAADLVMSIF